MNEWSYTFPPITKDEWLQRINRDIEKSEASLLAEWWPGESLIPFHHVEDRKESEVILPDHLFEKPPKIIEWFSIQGNHGKMNSRIVNSLIQGAESVIIELNDIHQEFMLEWLEGVHLEMIDVKVVSTPQRIPPSIPSGIKIRLHRQINQSAEEFFQNVLRDSDQNKNQFEFAYAISASGNFITQTTRILQSWLSDNEYLEKKGFEKTNYTSVFQFIPDHDYIKQLIQMRVIQLVFLNLLHTREFQTSEFKLEVHIHPDDNTSEEINLIKVSENSLAASLCGVNGICFHSQSNSDRPFFDRVNRNIHHLLDVESEMYKGRDPLGGSYTIDFYTQKWTEAIWSGLAVG